MENNLNNWVKYIGTQTIPVFNSTVQAVLNLTMDEKSSCKQLADTILQDAALTTRVLRVANSPYYNRNNTRFTNIRRIVLLIGFKKISEICLTLAILDSLVDKNTRNHVHTVTSKSFHAAIQARSIAEIYNLADPDMVYMAALLYNIGEIAFWSLTGKSGKLISDLLNRDNVNNEEAQENILGTTFRKLSLGLASEWQLSDLLKKALTEPTSKDPKVKSILYGHMIAESIIEKKSNYKLISEKIAKESHNSYEDINKTIHENILLTNHTYRFYVN